MARRRWKGLLASALIGAVAVVGYGCSSSSGNPVADAGKATHRDAGAIAPVDAGTGDDGSDGAPAGAAFDGTSGKACMSNADCTGPATGVVGSSAANTNVCSNSYTFQTIDGVPSPQLWPTPLCLVPLPTVQGVGNCDPGAQGLQFCDSADPMDDTSPGVCLPLTNPQQAGATNGLCLPHCTFKFDGSLQMGCPGKDTCNPLNYEIDTTNYTTITGEGFCQGTCQADLDCAGLGAGWVCQIDDGFCTKTKKTPTKALGTTCTNSGPGTTPVTTSDTETGACNCPYSGSSTVTAFYCTQACAVGGTPCPSGYVCDAQVPGIIGPFTGADGGDLYLPGPTMQNPGLAGVCLATCSPDGGAGDAGAGDAGAGDAGAGDAGSGRCPALSTCLVPSDPSMFGTAAGPDCVPGQ